MTTRNPEFLCKILGIPYQLPDYPVCDGSDIDHFYTRMHPLECRYAIEHAIDMYVERAIGRVQ